MVEIRPGRNRAGRYDESDRRHDRPEFQGHVACGAGRAIPDQRAVAAESWHRLRFGLPVGRSLTHPADQPGLAFWCRRSEPGRQDFRLGSCCGIHLRWHRQGKQSGAAAGRSRWPGQPGRLVRQHRHSLSVGELQLEVLSVAESSAPTRRQQAEPACGPAPSTRLAHAAALRAPDYFTPAPDALLPRKYPQ